MKRVTWTIAILWCSVAAAAAEPAARRALGEQDVHAQVSAWLADSRVDDALRARVEALWADAPPTASEEDLLMRVADSYALLDPRADELVSLCSRPRDRQTVPATDWLADPDAPRPFAANLRLLYARWLIHESLYDEAQEQLAGLKPEQVVAPAMLLFYQGVAAHALVDKETGLKAIEELLKRHSEEGDASPRRYVELAQLMQNDLKGLKDDSLDHIARRMDDIRRRLDFGRAGPKVRQVEDGVIESLDKIIEEIEKRQQQSESGAAGALQPNHPASESWPMGGKGPGEVTKKDIGAGGGWGDLPPRQRDEAMQQIGRDFPSHYRDAIEQYFRRLATEGSE